MRPSLVNRDIIKRQYNPFEHLFGQKKVYLPSFTIALLRTPNLPPTEASFIVPLNLTKLDLRDYLYHVYNVRCRNIRSFVKLQPARYDRKLMFKGREVPDGVWGRRLWRPTSVKKMTVELEKPFVWPAEPKESEDFAPWDKETYDAAHSFRESQYDKHYDNMIPGRRKQQPASLELRKQASELLEGKQRWRPSWTAIGGMLEGQEKEVDTDEPFVPTAR